MLSSPFSPSPEGEMSLFCASFFRRRRQHHRKTMRVTIRLNPTTTATKMPIDCVLLTGSLNALAIALKTPRGPVVTEIEGLSAPLIVRVGTWEAMALVIIDVAVAIPVAAGEALRGSLIGISTRRPDSEFGIAEKSFPSPETRGLDGSEATDVELRGMSAELLEVSAARSDVFFSGTVEPVDATLAWSLEPESAGAVLALAAGAPSELPVVPSPLASLSEPAAAVSTAGGKGNTEICPPTG
jgi:hypothetical protein